MQLGNAYLQRGRETGDPSYYAKAEEAVKKALELDPGSPGAMSAMGALALGRHQFREAAEWARRALEAGPVDASASATYGLLGDAQVELGQYQEAIQSYQTMVALKPNLDSYARVSYIRELMGDPQGAIKAMEMAVAAGSPRGEATAWALVQLGNLQFNAGRLQEAARSYEAALDAFLLELLQGPGGMRFREDLPHLLRPVAFYGALNSLVQVLLKLTVPGIPDIYQGGELWDLSLVDPDNRRPVDFALRARLLEELLPAGAVSPRSDLADLWRTWPDGRVKLLLTALGLRFRRAQAALFADGAYLPLLVEGPARRHACAFARTLGGRWAVTVMPRLACTLMGGPQEIGGWEPALPVGQAVWAETRVRLPAGAPRRWRNVLTGEEVQAEVVGPHGDGAVALGHLFRTFPLALLAGDVTLDGRHFGVLRSARGRPFRLLPE